MIKKIIFLVANLILITSFSACEFICFKDEFEISKWPGGVIHFFIINKEITSTSKLEMIYKSMDAWEACGANIEFIEVGRDRKYDADTLRIYPDADRSYSTYGYQPGSSKIELTKWAEISKITVEHELGHTLGLLHEFQRPDRGQYVIINWDYVVDKSDFEIHDNNLITEAIYPYDYYSVMEYVSLSVSPIDPKITITREGLTEIDCQKMREIYGK